MWDGVSERVRGDLAACSVASKEHLQGVSRVSQNRVGVLFVHLMSQGPLCALDACVLLRLRSLRHTVCSVLGGLCVSCLLSFACCACFVLVAVSE